MAAFDLKAGLEMKHQAPTSNSREAPNLKLQSAQQTNAVSGAKRLAGASPSGLCPSGLEVGTWSFSGGPLAIYRSWMLDVGAFASLGSTENSGEPTPSPRPSRVFRFEVFMS
jgi:hypothetical protein